MVLVKYGNSFESARLLGRYTTKQDALDAIDTFLFVENIDGSSRKSWIEDDIEIIDFGSWSNFFYIKIEEEKAVIPNEVKPNSMSPIDWSCVACGSSKGITSLINWIDYVLIPNHAVLRIGNENYESVDYIVILNRLVYGDELLLITADARGTQTFEECSFSHLSVYNFKELLARGFDLCYSDQFFPSKGL